MLKQIWNPDKDFLTQLRVLFMVAVPVSLLLSLVLNQLFPNYAWHILSIFLVVGIIIVRLIASIRFSIIEGTKLENQNHKFFKKLSGVKRVRFIKTLIGVGIFFLVMVTGMLYLVNLFVPIENMLIFFLSVIFLGIYVSSMRSVYLKLANDDQELW